MNKIIRGRRYDSDTAEKVGSFSRGFLGDSDYISEDLHRKKTGEFFLHCEGGCRTAYAQETSYGVSGGEEIKPLKYEEARYWAEKHLTVEEYEKVFGAVKEDDEKVQKIFMLSKENVEILKRISAQKNLSLSDTVAEMILQTGKKLEII